MQHSLISNQYRYTIGKDVYPLFLCYFDWNCVATVGNAFFGALPNGGALFYLGEIMVHDKNDLENLGIHELRKLARTIGVKAPTTKRKSDLINEILLIKSGNALPHITRLGRPALESMVTIEQSSLKNKLTEEKLDELLFNLKQQILDLLK